MPAQDSGSRWMLSTLEHLCRPVCELSAAPMSDKQDYYWTLSDRRTGRLTHSTDSRSYFIGPLISPSCLYSISSLTLGFFSPLSLWRAFISFATVVKVNRFSPHLQESGHSLRIIIIFIFGWPFKLPLKHSFR